MKQPVNSSLQGCLELFLDRCESENLSPATIQFYLGNIGRFVRFLADEHNLENPSVEDFKAEYIKEYLFMAKSSKKWEAHLQIKTKKEKLSSQSLRTYARALRAFGNWLFMEGFIKENILELVQLPKASKSYKVILDDSEIETIMKTFNTKNKLGMRDAIIFILAFDCGIRQGGIVNLLIRDVDLKAKTISVRLKGGDITCLPIGNTLVKQIREYKVKYRSLGKENEPLLTNNLGGKLTENAVKKMFTKLKKTTGIERINCHLGRHTFATNYMMEGHSQQELQLALAHESEFMSKNYVHLAKRATFLIAGADSHFDKMLINNKDKKMAIAKVQDKVLQ